MAMTIAIMNRIRRKGRVWTPDPANTDRSGEPFDHPGDPANRTRPDAGRPLTPPAWASNTTAHRRRGRRVLAAALAVLLMAAACGGLAAWRSIGAGRAEERCTAAAAAAADRRDALDRLLGADDTTTALAVTAGQTADTATVDTLARAAANARKLLASPVPECRIDYWDPGNDATAIDAASAAGDKADARRTGLAKAVEAVLASRDEKTLEDARAALDARTGEARALLDSSDGRVQDAATRDALSRAIDLATAGRGGDDPAAINALTDALGQAMDRVNESIAAKQQADAQAAAAAAQAQAQAQSSRSQSSSRRNAYSGGTSSGSSDSSGSTYRAPASGGGSPSSESSSGSQSSSGSSGGASDGFCWDCLTVNESCASDGFCPIG